MELVSRYPHTGTSMGRSGAGRAIWMALIVAGGASLSLLFACATPFAALATLAALKTDRRDTAVALGLVWLVNQVIGYAFLGYPWTWDSLAWGAAIGVAAGVALLVAMGLAPQRPAPMAVSLPFMGAFAAYELSLYVAGFALPGSDSAFSFAIIRQLFVVNVMALAGLVIAYQLALLAGLLVRERASNRIAAAH